ncbi:conserved hypothetical protein [Thermofilum pendens Hrk 5]|uniref:Uncharacterized protein n=1 Tax=Thermofilum pendens (strain DSM 2475 / Hrk 5) TaxID=368408 RepID=A1RZ82_THEPD|nr:conserved hypothetical protein [Thermofilum pendens Hrk 5]
MNFLVGWIVSGIAVWLALKLFPGKQKAESIPGAFLTALIGALIFWVFKVLHIPFGTLLAILVWLYALRKIQGVGWLGAAVLAVLVYLINALFGLFLPTLL